MYFPVPLSNVGEAEVLFKLSSYNQFCDQICLLRLQKQQYHQLSRQHAQEHS